jgi:hypothetical protein
MMADAAGAACPAEPVSSLVVRRAAELDAVQRTRLTAIYEQAFPAHLRVPLADLTTPGPRDQLVVAVDGTDPVGFAAVRWLTSANWVFLRYFGVASDRRRQRLGLRFWRRLRPSLAAAGWPTRIAFEIEDPADVPGDPAEQTIRLGRMHFWQSCGAISLPVPGYVMPALTAAGFPEPMILMAADSHSPGDLDQARLTALVQAIYTEHYQLPPDHPLPAAALESIGSGHD